MSDKASAHKTLAEAVEILEEAGFDVDQASVVDVPNQTGMGALAGMFGAEPSTNEKAMVVLDSRESDEQEIPDDPDHFDEEATEIDINNSGDEQSDDPVKDAMK